MLEYKGMVTKAYARYLHLEIEALDQLRPGDQATFLMQCAVTTEKQADGRWKVIAINHGLSNLPSGYLATLFPEITLLEDLHAELDHRGEDSFPES